MSLTQPHHRVWTAVAASILTLLAACGEPPPPSRTDVIFGLQLEPPVLDPTINPAQAIAQITQLNIFEGLTRIDESGAVQPGLAASWDVSDDARTYTFHLREGVQFADGTAFESGDVKFTFERNAAEGSTNSRRSYFSQMERIETPDLSTVAVTLAEPSALFLFNMAESMSVIVAPESADTNTTVPVGTGPYRLDSWFPGESVVLMRNPLYRDAESIAIDRVEFRFIGDAAAQIAALQAGDVDVFPSIGALEAVPQFEADPRFQVLVGTTEGEVILALNNSRAPFNVAGVRRAVSQGIERQEIIEGAMFGYGTRIGSHFAPHHPAYVDLTEAYPEDIDRARSHLAQAGVGSGGLSFTITVPPTTYAQRSAEIIRSQLQKLNITVEIEQVEWARWLEVVYSDANYEATIIAHVEPMDIATIYSDPSYYFRYDSQEFRDIIAAANRATDPGEQAGYWAAAQVRLAEDAVNAFLFELPKVGIAAAGLQGLWRNWPMFINDIAALHWAASGAN
jgi:peptide/nickel transport system substrate-binding protein